MRRIALAAIMALTVCLAGCGNSTDEPQKTTSAPATSSGVTGTVTVFAAASLTESFTKIGKDFEAANPGTKVTFNFAGSGR